MAQQEVSILTPEGKPAVTSLQLAEDFGIKHRHVLRDIKSIVDKIPKSFTESNFGLSEYTDSTGRALPCYLLTRDAFTLLAMGYNSSRAIDWKLRYIAGFNALEEALRDRIRNEAAISGVATGAQGMLELTPLTQERIRKIKRLRAKGLTRREVAKLMDLHPRTVNSLISSARKLGLGV